MACCVFEDAIPVPALIRSSREGEGSCITSHDFFPKQHLACITTTFLQTCCSKKEVSHLQSLPRNFCVDAALSDFVFFWVFLMSVLLFLEDHFASTGSAACTRRNVSKNWRKSLAHPLPFTVQCSGEKGGILRETWEYPKNWYPYISDSCCMLGNACWLLLIWSEYTIYASCLFGVVWSFVWFVWVGLLLVSIHLHVWCSVCELDTR